MYHSCFNFEDFHARARNKNNYPIFTDPYHRKSSETMPLEVKDIECSAKCGVLTTVHLPKPTHHRNKKFLFGLRAALKFKENTDAVTEVKRNIKSQVKKLGELLR